jgi:hypothetical protein
MDLRGVTEGPGRESKKGMSKIRRIGLTRDPPGGWPLDHLFVGVATLRILRELFMRPEAHRPWDLHLRTGVSPQGSADALRRLAGIGLVDVLPSHVPGYADWFQLARDHYLVKPLGMLFGAEDEAARNAVRKLRNPAAARRDQRSGRAGCGPPA